MLACGDREAMVMTPSPTCDSAVLPCFCGCLAFLHRHFPPQSPSSHPLDPSVCSQQQPSPWDCSTISKLQLPAAAPSRRSAFLRGTYGCSKDCLILIPFRLSQISCFPLSLKCFCSDSGSCPAVGIGPLLQFPHLLRAGPVLLTLLFFPLVPSSYQVLHGSIYSFFFFIFFFRFYILFSTGQVLLSALRWCSTCTSVSEGVFLMYLWREMYSTSTYSSSILFSNL